MAQREIEILNHLEVVIQEEKEKLKQLNQLPAKEDDTILLKSILKAVGMNQTEFARAINMDMSTISNILAGKRQLTRKQIGKICKAFDLEPTIFRFE
jgi:predicted transcriptional regulator